MPGVSLGITLPTVGVTVGTDYAEQINSAIQTIIDDIEAKISPSEVETTSDWDFSSGGVSYSLLNSKRIAFTNQGSPLSSANTQSVYVSGGELYYQDSSGTNVQITSGGTLNAATAGSINTTGSPAYGAGPEVLWSGGDLEYRFKKGAGATDFANLVFDDLEFRSGTFTMTMGCGVTSDYSITWPATAAAANNSLMEISTAGVVAFTKTLSVTSLTATGDVQGDDLKHSGVHTLYIPPSMIVKSGGATTYTIAAPPYISASADNDTFHVPIPLKNGDSITTIHVLSESNDTTNPWTVDLRGVNTLTGADASKDSETYTHTSTGTPQNSGDLGMGPVSGSVDRFVYCKITSRGTVARIYGVIVTYTRT